MCAIERIKVDYSDDLDMSYPDEFAALFVEDCEVSYARKFGATDIEPTRRR